MSVSEVPTSWRNLFRPSPICHSLVFIIRLVHNDESLITYTPHFPHKMHWQWLMLSMEWVVDQYTWMRWCVWVLKAVCSPASALQLVPIIVLTIKMLESIAQVRALHWIVTVYAVDQISQSVVYFWPLFRALHWPRCPSCWSHVHFWRAGGNMCWRNMGNHLPSPLG